MPGRISWDEPGTRQFASGLDRGVLYPRNQAGVPWNGLVSLSENDNRSTKAYYLDGVKYLDHEVAGEWSGKLQAFTYPEALDELMGTRIYAPGVRVHDQPSRTFSLSYRTTLGNDLVGDEAGHLIHILYNVRAILDDLAHATRGQNVAPEMFSWTLTATPPYFSGARPTAHISIDTRDLPSEKMVELENMLYGTTELDPLLFDLPVLLETLSAGEG